MSVKIEDFTVGHLTEGSKYIKPFRIHYKQTTGKTGLDTVESGGAFPSSLLPPSTAGEALELCAGLIDGEDTDPASVAAREVYEECGYRIEPSSLRLVNKYLGNVGLMGTQLHLFYAEVTQAHHVPNAGGGLREEGECIQVVEWPLDQLDDLLSPNDDRTSTVASLLYALSWFKGEIFPSLQNK